MQRMLSLVSTPALVVGSVLALLAAAPAAAGGFHLFGTYADFNDLDDALGAGIGLTFDVGPVVQIDFRTSYYEQIDSNAFDDFLDDFPDADEIFLDNIQVQPIEVGVHFRFDRGGFVTPYLGVGAGYYLLDVDNGELDDEAGFYGLGGLRFGDQQGASFFVEAQYREIEANVTDVDALDDLDDADIDFDGPIDIDVGGISVNLGVVFQF